MTVWPRRPREPVILAQSSLSAALGWRGRYVSYGRGRGSESFSKAQRDATSLALLMDTAEAPRGQLGVNRSVELTPAAIVMRLRRLRSGESEVREVVVKSWRASVSKG